MKRRVKRGASFDELVFDDLCALVANGRGRGSIIEMYDINEQCAIDSKEIASLLERNIKYALEHAADYSWESGNREFVPILKRIQDLMKRATVRVYSPNIYSEEETIEGAPPFLQGNADVSIYLEDGGTWWATVYFTGGYGDTDDTFALNTIEVDLCNR